MKQTVRLVLLCYEEVVLKDYATCVQTIEHLSKEIILSLFDTDLL